MSRKALWRLTLLPLGSATSAWLFRTQVLTRYGYLVLPDTNRFGVLVCLTAAAIWYSRLNPKTGIRKEMKAFATKLYVSDHGEQLMIYEETRVIGP